MVGRCKSPSQHQVLVGDPDPRAQGLRVKAKTYPRSPSDRSSLITYADGMIVSLHTVCSQNRPPLLLPRPQQRRAHIGGRSPRRRREAGSSETHAHITAATEGWMTLCVYARVTSRLSTTSAQVSGTHALGWWWGIILPSSSLS